MTVTEQPDADLIAAGYRRRARLQVDASTLARVLQLPEGQRVIAAFASPDPVGMTIIIEGDEFDLVPPNAQAPYLTSGVVTEQIIIEDELSRHVMETAEVDLPAGRWSRMRWPGGE